MSASRKRGVMAALHSFMAAGLVGIGCSGDGPTGAGTPAATVSITAAPAEGVLLVGASFALEAVASDAAGGRVPRTIAWTSLNTAVATVSAAGMLNGLSAGPTLVVARADAVADTILVSVRAPIPMTPAGATAAATTSVLGGAVQLTIPPAAGAATQLTVAPAALLPDDNRILSGAAFDFGPDGATFTTPITMSLRYDNAAVPAAKRSRVRINRVEEDGTLTMLDGGAVDLANSRVSAPVSSFSTYALVVPGDVASILPLEGNSQAANVGSPVQGLSVIVRDAQQRPVPVLDIAFAVLTGGGSIEGAAIATTDANGVATLPGSWILGPNKGQQTLRATIVGDGRGVTFTATAVAPAVAVRVQSAPTTGFSGVSLNPPLIVQVVDVFGDPVLEIGRQVTATILSGNGVLLGDLVMDAPTGSAIFQNLRIAGGGEHRIVLSSGTLIRDTTEVITVTQQLGQVVITTQPAGAASGVPFTTQPVIELRDNAGLRLEGGEYEVLASAVHGPGTPIGGLTAMAVNGIATFSGLAIEGEGTQTLRFGVGSIDVISAPIAVGPPPPGVYLRVGATPSVTLIPGQGYAPDIVMDLNNAAGANIASVNVTVTWDTAQFQFEFASPMPPWTDVDGASSTVTFDESSVADGVLVINGSTPGAATNSFTLVRMALRARNSVTSTVQTTIGATVNTATNAAAAAVPVIVRPLAVRIEVPPAIP